MSYVDFQTSMVKLARQIARTSQDMVCLLTMIVRHGHMPITNRRKYNLLKRLETDLILRNFQSCLKTERTNSSLYMYNIICVITMLLLLFSIGG